ncbi:MAG: hypothetical protein C0606_11080 [Hyphomicrobiales bacterium]|nr:MAG: hypothetical protein C0606_11080 [Hyphomicrobiales bacterium]
MALALAAIAPAAMAENPAPTAEDAKAHHKTVVIEKLARLNHAKFLKVVKELGLEQPTAFLGCLCGTYSIAGSGIGYHPEPWGNCNNTKPCKGGNWGCVSHELPTSAEVWASCNAKHPLASGTDLATAVVDKVAERSAAKPAGVRPPVDVSQCAAIRESGQTGALKGIPADRTIRTLSQEASKQMKKAFDDGLKEKAYEKIQRYLAEHPELKPDELDMRVDAGLWEIGFGKDENDRFIAKEIVLKIPKLKGNIGLDFGIGLKSPPKGSNIKSYEWDGKLKYGFAYEGSVQEAKYGIEIDTTKTTSDYYDGEWQKESEYVLVRFVENYVSKFDFYAGGATGVGDGNVNIGVEYTYKLRERYSDHLFSGMNAALDNLLDNQNEWERKRNDYVRREGERYGVDTRCMTTGQAIAVVRKAYEVKKAQDPSVEPPFEAIRVEVERRRAKAIEEAKRREAEKNAPRPPEPAKPKTAPNTGSSHDAPGYVQPMLK